MDKPLVKILYKLANGSEICVEVSTRYKNCWNSLTDKSAPKGGKTGDTLTLRLAQMEIQTALCCQPMLEM